MNLFFQSLCETDIGSARDELGDSVHFSIGNTHHPAHIPQDRPCLHLSKSDDLSNILLSIFIHHIPDHLIPSLHTEIDIHIRHAALATRIQKSFEDEVIFDGIQVRDIEGIGDQASSH